MEPASEALMRSALHDLANVLCGIRGILELSDPQQPLSPRDQSRLDAVIADGMVALIADIPKLIETAKNDVLRTHHAAKALQAEA